MALPKQLTERIEEIASQEGRSVESVLQTMLELYEREKRVSSRDPVEDFIGAFDDNVSDMSMSVRETLREYFQKPNHD